MAYVSYFEFGPHGILDFLLSEVCTIIHSFVFINLNLEDFGEECMNVVLGNMINTVEPVVIIFLPFGHLSRVNSSIVA